MKLDSAVAALVAAASRKEPTYKAKYRRKVRGEVEAVGWLRARHHTSDVVVHVRPPSLELLPSGSSEPAHSLDLLATEYSVPKACLLRFKPVGEQHHEELTFKSEAELRAALKPLLDHAAGLASKARPLRLVCATWNLGNVLPSQTDEQLAAWLRPDGKAADLYVVTCQELPLLPLHQERAWFDMVEKAVSSEEEPVEKVGSASLGQQHLLVLCSPALRPHVTSVETESAAMGFAGFGANKGVVALSMRVHATPLCVVGAHLAPHEGAHHCEQRNANVSEMERRLRCGSGSGARPAAVPSAAAASLDLSQRFEHVLLCGDLNYRVELTRDEALELVRRRAGAEAEVAVRIPPLLTVVCPLPAGAPPRMGRAAQGRPAHRRDGTERGVQRLPRGSHRLRAHVQARAGRAAAHRRAGSSG